MAVFLVAVAQGDTVLQPGLLARMCDTLAVAGKVQSAAQGEVALAYCDLGLWPGRSDASTAESLTVIAGDPLICKADHALQRQESISEIASMGINSTLLASAEGSYCGIVWDRSTLTLMAFTDKLGVRPIYFARSESVLYISSSQWALNALRDVPKEPDWRAATEVAAFGYPLEDRTLYANIKVLCAGETLVANAKGFKAKRYWDWVAIQTNQLNGAALINFLHDRFNTAVDDRLRNQKRVMAFLSGGMDSRLIVSRLRENNVLVYSLNFAPEGSQDLAFGHMAARAIGTDHFEFGGGTEALGQRRGNAMNAWRNAHRNVTCWPEQPNLIWSGDGGSVTLGHVYLDEEILKTARTRGLEAAASAIQRRNKLVVSKRIFLEPHRHFADVPLQGIVDDLHSRLNVEPGRNCHYFFMLNDQRRHLADHYETVHLTRIDFVLPFFDGRFLAAVLGSTIDPFMMHALYNELMQLLPNQAGKVPWQAYPGHVPCPFPVPSNLRRQWEDGWLDPALRRREDRKRYKVALQRVMSPSFPSHILSRPALIAAGVASGVGINKAWVLNAIEPFLKAWAPNSVPDTPLPSMVN
jgi:hypothetical protein